jgi:hypothetical protein
MDYIYTNQNGKKAHNYIEVNMSQPCPQLHYRYWNALGIIPEVMIRENIMCGFHGITREMIDLKLIKVGYLMSAIEDNEISYSLGYKAYKEEDNAWHARSVTTPSLFHMANYINNKTDVDILICMGLLSAEEMGACDTQFIKNICHPICLIHIEEEKEEFPSYQNIALEAKMQCGSDATTKKWLARAVELLEKAEQKIKLAHKLVVTRAYVGISSLSERLTEPENLIRILGRKLRISHGNKLVSIPPFISKVSSQPKNKRKINEMGDTEPDGNARGGFLIQNKIKAGEKLKPVGILDFSSFYPSICVNLFSKDNVLHECMTELIRMRDIYRGDPNSLALDMGYKNVANIITGCQEKIFPDQYENMTARGRNILETASEFMTDKLKLRVVYGHTDSLFVESLDKNKHLSSIAKFVEKEFSVTFNLKLQSTIYNLNVLGGNGLFGLEGNSENAKVFKKALPHHNKGFPSEFKNIIDNIIFHYLHSPKNPMQLIDQLNELNHRILTLDEGSIDGIIFKLTCSTPRGQCLPLSEARDELKDLFMNMMQRGEILPAISQPIPYLHVIFAHDPDGEKAIWESPRYVKNNCNEGKIKLAWGHYYKFYLLRPLRLIFEDGRSAMVTTWMNALSEKIEQKLTTQRKEGYSQIKSLWDDYLE